ncbi:MAG: YihY/virulence factor BrkB family protein [Chitinophagales bacterium]|nr:YihY/virulence factor BrkB family protein [Chitinophagales bacterium]
MKTDNHTKDREDIKKVQEELKSPFSKLSHTWPILKKTAKAWMAQDPSRQSAVIAYYAIISLPALLVIIVAITGKIWGKEAVTGKLSGQFSNVMGTDAAKQIEEMIKNAAISDKTVIATILAVVILLMGATGVFVQLQKSLNMIWEVKPSPGKAFLKLLKVRILSFGLVLTLGFLLLVSLVITTVISFFGVWLTSRLPEVAVVLLQIINFIITFGFVTVLFALMFKFLPDAKIQWKDVWIGAIVTAILFSLGKEALGIFFGKFPPATAFGAAGSIVLIMLWLSYSSMILFFGAEFTRQYATWGGREVPPIDEATKDPYGRIKINK